MAQQGLDHFGKVDIVVSVAAIRPHKPVLEIGYDEWHQVFEVNLHSTFYLAKAFAPAMIKRGVPPPAGIAKIPAFPWLKTIVSSSVQLAP